MSDTYRPTYDGQQPAEIDAILHDHVVGTQITLWFRPVDGAQPIGIRMWDDTAKELRGRLIDLIDHIE